MTIEEIARGESSNLEFKVSLPEKAENYVKTIIAFANSQGGQLIIGVDDKTRKVIGIDDSEFSVFQIMESISNAVSDLCEPQIVPNIELQTLDEKTVISVTVLPGANRPYFLKSKGKEKGTYIRVANTTRPALSEKIKELEMEGSRISWDELSCVGYTVTEEAIEGLCHDIMQFRKKAGLPEHDVTKEQLVNWKLLKQTGKFCMASNAFVLLTSDYFQFSRTQCAVFKGTNRNVFLDKKEFSGPLYRQIEDAINFVLRNIRLGATVEGMLRRETYELPIEAIREMIINAHCHRSLTEESCVQVAVYDDRLEVTSPGGLYNGLTWEEMINGHSKIRNRAIANVFCQMGLVESWGTGIKKILTSAKKYKLPPPEFLVFDNMFRVNLFKKGVVRTKKNNKSDKNHKDKNKNITSEKTHESIGLTSVKKSSSIGIKPVHHRYKSAKTVTPLYENLNETCSKIIPLLRQNSKMNGELLANAIGISKRNIEANIKKLKEKGILIRHGSRKDGYWEVIG